MKSVLVTGANGFIGSVLCRRLVREKLNVFGAVRSAGSDLSSPGVNSVKIGNLDPETNWSAALKGIDAVVHLAARVHVMEASSSDPLQAYRTVNVLGTERLALQAAAAGVGKFIFLSTVKVNGEESRKVYTESDPPFPVDHYGISKLEAEKRLAEINAKTGLETVILRPPLVYGPGVKANFLRLLQVVDRGIPLPLANVKNQRSMIYVENLVDAIVHCLRNPAATGKTFLVSDGQDVSTPQLVRMIAAALNKKPRLFPFPLRALDLAAGLAGKRPAMNRLSSSLSVDTSRLKNELGWKAPFSLKEGLQETALWYKGTNLFE